MTRPPLPPFDAASAAAKVQAAEDAWNTRDPERVAAAYSPDSVWRNRDQFLTGRAEITAFLAQKWARELEYALRKDLWAFEDNHIATRFQYECHDVDGQWLNRTWRPRLTDLKLGWESYGEGADTIWYDDVALGSSRIGC